MKLLRRPLLLSEPLWSSRNTNGCQVVGIINRNFIITLFQEKFYLIRIRYNDKEGKSEKNISRTEKEVWRT